MNIKYDRLLWVRGEAICLVIWLNTIGLIFLYERRAFEGAEPEILFRADFSLFIELMRDNTGF